MFTGASMFNGDISNWDVSSVTDMSDMFWDATNFKQTLCGAAWVHSNAKQTGMWKQSFGAISKRVCPSVPIRFPVTNRELIARTSPTVVNTMTCPKCGSFKKSGRVSCCAPGGAWFKNCGGTGDGNVGHKWVEGVQACKSTATTTISSACSTCGTIGKSGKASCCGRGGSWFKNCGNNANPRVDHTWYEGIQACSARTALNQLLNAAQQKGMDASNAPTTILITGPAQPSISTSAPLQGCEKLLIVCINLLLIIVT